MTDQPLPASAPPKPAKRPASHLPDGAVDSHIHMLAGPGEYPLWENRVEDPAPGWDMSRYLDAYRAQCRAIGVSRSVVVHSILYGADNSVTLATIKALGPDQTRGIGLLRDGASEAEIDALHAGGVRGIRLNYVHGGVLSWAGAKALAPALAERGMHIQMLVNADRHLAELAADIRALAVPVVFDHIAWPDIAAGPAEPGFAELCALVGDGAAYVKLSGLYRFCTEPFAQTDPLVAALVAANPERCLWGSDWPYIMLAGAEMPQAGALVDALTRVVSRSSDIEAIAVGNPVRLYGFD